MLAADTMEALGIPRGSYVVKVNNRKVLDGVMEAAKIAADKRLTVLRAIDKLDRLGIGEVARLLGPGRLDESGDVTIGANLSDEQIGILLTYMQGGDLTSVRFESRGNIKDRPLVEIIGGLREGEDGQFLFFEYDNETRVEQLRRAIPDNDLYLSGLDELAGIATLCNSAGYSKSRIAMEPSVVRGLEYYTGPVYEVELLLDTKDDKGRPVRFGSVGGGGRYDGLVSRFRGEPVPATGFSIGVSRLMAALTLLKKIESKPEPGPVVVTVFGAENLASSQQLVQKLRAANIRAELYLGNPKHSIGQQLKYADKRGSPCAVIQGPDEKAKNEVQVRDLIQGATATDIKERDEYLKKQAEAQVPVDEDKLVDVVRELLARHGIKHS
jgi:histidyl-tRNA synthetase